MDDCCNAAKHLAAQGLVDPARLCIDGGSAGGYTTLACLAFRWPGRLGALRACRRGRAGRCSPCHISMRMPAWPARAQLSTTYPQLPGHTLHACSQSDTPMPPAARPSFPCQGFHPHHPPKKWAQGGARCCAAKGGKPPLQLATPPPHCPRRRDVFAAGASHYGVADLELLAQETHKFESRCGFLGGLQCSALYFAG